MRRVQPGFPSVGHEVAGADYALIYGPLAVAALIFLTLLIGLWRAYVKRQDEHEAVVGAVRKAQDVAIEAERKRADAAIEAARSAEADARSEFFAQLEQRESRHLAVLQQLTHEAHEVTRTVADKVLTELVAQRAVVEAALRRIGRPGD